ncbi:major facilitator superfamily domain-containing protein [Flammula alnicola]|nr:major facilitator superfamily domain-containing protein [Flammula alnicola]
MSLKAASEKGSDTTTDDFNTPEDKALVRKIDLRYTSSLANRAFIFPLTFVISLIPILTLLYLLSFLDRYVFFPWNATHPLLGSACIPPEYNTSLALYFIAYVIFEVPANRFDPQIWLPTITLLWGIVSVGQGLVKNKAGLFGIRFLLGVAEAGLFPGTIYVFSVYYRRRERSWRVAIFFGGAALAGAFGGILAFAIGKMDGVGGRKGWEWIFILEGILTVAISLLAYFIVPTWSHKAKFLTESERKRLLERLNADSDAGLIESFEWVYVRQALTDHLVWGYAFLFHGFSFVLYSLSLFLPTIITGLGFASWQAQLMTVPPNSLAALSIWGTVWLSSRVDRRAPFIIGAAGIAIIGLAKALAIVYFTAGAQYVGTLFAAAGVYTGNALLLSWPGENVSAQTKRAVAVAMQITIGDIGAVSGVLVYRPSLSGHRFRKPHIIAIGYLVFAILVTVYLSTWMRRENRRRDLVLSQSKDEYEAPSAEDRQRLGDRHPHYRYVI